MIVIGVMLFIALAMIIITFVSFGVWVIIPALCIWGIYKIVKQVCSKKDKPDLVIMSRKDFEQQYEKKKPVKTAKVKKVVAQQ